ncbi:phage tail tape measure protein [Bacillus smithii]|uniref:phage tail tape measure protein n=1 Tax=Bacillus smithii TaxID=1479 RepID=UPI003D1D2CCC
MAGNKPLGNMVIGLSMNGTQFSNTLKGIKAQIRQAQSAMKANLAVLGNAGDEYGKLEAKIQGLNEVMSANQRHIDILRKKHQEAIETYGEGSVQVSRLATQINNAVRNQGAWERQLQQTKAKLAELESSSQQFANKLNEIGQKASESSEKLKGTGETLSKIFTAPMAAVSALGARVSSEISSITGSIQAMTGATSSEAKKQGKIVGKVWADGFGDSIDQVGEAVIKVKQNLQGIDDSQLESVTEKALTLSKITGADLDESLRGVNSLMVNFGMSANQAFDYMVTGAQRGLNKSGELEDNIAEYGQLWAQAGFSAKDMFAILENGLKSGAYNFDKVNDFVKEFGISLSDGRFEKNISSFSKRTQELFNKYKDGKATVKDVFMSAISDLDHMKNQQEKLTIASTVWSALGEDNAMKVIQSLNNTNHAYDNVTGAANKASQAMTNTPAAKLQKACRGLQQDLKPVGDTLMNMAAAILPKIGDVINAIMKPFQNMSPTMQAVTVLIAGFIGSLGPLIMVGGMVAGSISNIIMALKSLSLAMGATSISGGLLAGAMSILTSPITLIIGSIALLAGGFVLAYTKIKPFHDFVNKLASAIMSKVKPAFDSFKTTMTNVFNTVSSFVMSKIAVLKQFWQQNGNQIIQATRNVFTVISAVIKVAMIVLGPIIKGAMFVIRAIIVSVWNNIKGVITGTLNIIMGVTKIFGGLFTGHWRQMWEGIKQLFKGVFQLIWNWMQLLWFGKMLKGALAFGSVFKSAFKAIWNAIKAIFLAPIKWIVALVKSSFSGMNKTSIAIFNGMKNSIRVIWNAIKDHTVKPIQSAFKTITSTLSNLRTRALDIFNSLKDGAGKIWNKMIETFKSLPSKMADALKKGAKSIGNAMKSVSKVMLEGLAKGVNGVTGGINWILDKVHAPKKLRIPKWTIPQYAKGTDDHPGGLAVVSDGKGKNKQELIALPNGQMFLSPKQETIMNLPKGTSVLNGDATAQLLSTLPKYASGKGWLQGAWDTVKGVASKTKDVVKDVWEYASNPKKLIELAINKFTNLSGILNPTLAIVKGMITRVKDGAVNWIKSLFDLGGDNPPGTGVQRWRPYVIRALEMNGLSTSESMIRKVLRQIQTESGGNPRAVQHGYTDINTIRGDLAKGLMQTISATFNAYKFPGHGNIFNGFDNLLAALNYAKHRYGKNLNGLGEGHGYANGGFVTNEQIARIAEGNKPEAIIPLTKKTRALQLLAKTQQILGVPNGGTVIVNNNYDEIIARQDAQITLMQQQIDLLTQLLLKDTTLEVDGRQIARVTAKYMDEELNRQKLNKARASGRVSFA